MGNVRVSGPWMALSGNTIQSKSTHVNKWAMKVDQLTLSSDEPRQEPDRGRSAIGLRKKSADHSLGSEDISSGVRISYADWTIITVEYKKRLVGAFIEVSWYASLINEDYLQFFDRRITIDNDER